MDNYCSLGRYDLLDLTGKVAVVTGGSRGLGRAMVEAFAAQGADVAICSRKLSACEDLAEEIRHTTGRQAVGFSYNASNWQEADQLMERVIDRFGRCDILVMNAGLSPVYASLESVSEELFDKVVAVNLKGAFRLGVITAERMKAFGGGSIVAVSSIAAVRPGSAELPYAAAKAGLNALAMGLARSYGPTVRCNVIMPGPFLTDMTKGWDMDAFDAKAQRTIPLGRGGHPYEIVGAALYLASSASSYTTGAVIKVDGGLA